MKNSQKGFIVPLLIIVAVLIVGVGGYLYFDNVKHQKFLESLSTISNTSQIGTQSGTNDDVISIAVQNNKTTPTTKSSSPTLPIKAPSSVIQPNKISSQTNIKTQSTPIPAQTPPSGTQPSQKILEKFATMVYDGPIYTEGAPDFYRVGRKFYETHPDVYDFLAVYSVISSNFQSGNGITVKNGIRGNGSFFPDLNETAKYGSSGKLLHFVFIPTKLGLDANTNIDLLDILAHEVSHHWLMFIGDSAACKDNPNSSVKCTKTTGFPVSEDGAHWSSNVDTAVHESGGVFKDPNSHGSSSYWQINANGYCSAVSVTAGNGFRFNDLDLYLMGFISPNEAKPIHWYDNIDASDLGQTCTQHTISAQDIINMEGLLQPPYPIAQRDFKIGFILLTAPGQSVTQQQISRMNYIIDNFPGAWNESTRKLSTMNIPL